MSWTKDTAGAVTIARQPGRGILTSRCHCTLPAGARRAPVHDSPHATRGFTQHPAVFTSGLRSCPMNPVQRPRRLTPLLMGLALCASLAATPAARADANLSEASLAISLAPVALSVGAVSATGVALSAAPVVLLSAGTALVVVSVQVVGGATVWVLERVSDGVRISIRTAGKLAEGFAVSTGAAVVVSVIGAGTLLSAAGEVIAFIPNEIGKALLHNERVTR